MDQHRLHQNPYLFITILSSNSTLFAVTSADQAASLRNLKSSQLIHFTACTCSYSARQEVLRYGTRSFSTVTKNADRWFLSSHSWVRLIPRVAILTVFALLKQPVAAKGKVRMARRKRECKSCQNIHSLLKWYIYQTWWPHSLSFYAHIEKCLQ
jgi:hypothetical protein